MPYWISGNEAERRAVTQLRSMLAGSELWEAAMSHAAPREVRVRVKGRGWDYSRGGMNEGIIQIHTHGPTYRVRTSYFCGGSEQGSSSNPKPEP